MGKSFEIPALHLPLATVAAAAAASAVRFASFGLSGQNLVKAAALALAALGLTIVALFEWLASRYDLFSLSNPL